MSKEKQIDYKAYARQMRENCARDHNGTEPIVICSLELWEEITTIIERFGKQSEGEWVKDAPHWNYHCNQCGFYPLTEYGSHLRFCPNCGAKMRKENEGK